MSFPASDLNGQAGLDDPESWEIEMNKQCGFPNDFAEPSGQCTDPAVDYVELEVHKDKYKINICQHHKSIAPIMWGWPKVAQMVLEGKIKFEEVL